MKNEKYTKNVHKNFKLKRVTHRLIYCKVMLKTRWELGILPACSSCQLVRSSFELGPSRTNLCLLVAVRRVVRHAVGQGGCGTVFSVLIFLSTACWYFLPYWKDCDVFRLVTTEHMRNKYSFVGFFIFEYSWSVSVHLHHQIIFTAIWQNTLRKVVS